MKRNISTLSRSHRHSQRPSNFSIDAAIVTSVSPLPGVVVGSDGLGGIHASSPSTSTVMSTTNSSTPSLDQPRSSTTSNLDLSALAQIAAGDYVPGPEERPLSSDSSSSTGSKSRRGIGRLFSRGRKNSQ